MALHLIENCDHYVTGRFGIIKCRHCGALWGLDDEGPYWETPKEREGQLTLNLERNDHDK